MMDVVLMYPNVIMSQDTIPILSGLAYYWRHFEFNAVKMTVRK